LTGAHGETIAHESKKYGTQELRKGKELEIATFNAVKPAVLFFKIFMVYFPQKFFLSS
jgi:hypothetical protein